MAVKDLTVAQIVALAGTRLAKSGALVITPNTENYLVPAASAFYHLDNASLGLACMADDAAATTVRVTACGQVPIAGSVYIYAGGAISLSSYNGDTALVYAYVNSGALALGAASIADGWPATEHVKVAAVTVAGSAISTIVDYRGAQVLSSSHDQVRYVLSLTTQGTTSGASTVTITLVDAAGQQIKTTDYLRVRICNSGAYATATNATIAAGANTTAVETMTSNKDLVLKSHTDGTFTVTLTDASAETVTLRIGPPTLSGRRGDYTATLNVTHAA
jgi:hypothetical protein